MGVFVGLRVLAGFGVLVEGGSVGGGWVGGGFVGGGLVGCGCVDGGSVGPGVGGGFGVLLGWGMRVLVGLEVEGGSVVLVGCGTGVFVGLGVRVGRGVLLGCGMGVRVGIPVAVPVGISVATRVGVGGVGEAGFVAVRVGRPDVLVGTGAYVPVAAGPPGFSRLSVGGKPFVSRENGVGAFPMVATIFKVTTATGVGEGVPGVPPPVTGMRMGPEGLGSRSASMPLAKATAVLFILAKDISCVLRACRSMAEGGVGFRPTNKNTIHASTPHRASAARA